MSLPKPYYEHDGITIYHGDCRDVLDELHADVTITDPPYGARTHGGARTGDIGDRVLIDFAPVDAVTFTKDCERLVALTNRWVVLTCEWRFVHLLEPIGLVRFGVWIKPNGAPQFTGDRPATGWEAVAILHREGQKKWNGGGRHAVWNVPKVSSEHPTGKPMRLIHQFVQLFSDEGETILDPFMGSGTTLRAAKDLRRKAIGIEIEEKYCEISAKRLEQEVFDWELHT